MRFTKCLWLVITVLAILSQVFITNGSPYEEYKTMDIEQLSFKQEIKMPIDTSLEISRYQPIDIRVVFSNPCWAKDETMHSVRVGYDDGSGLTEIESQIYDLEYYDTSHISSCSLVFLVPEEANGNEKYYVIYDSSETKQPDYDDHIVLEDTHYFYEPISGQKIDFDYYGIKEEGYVIYAIIQEGELLGNPISLAVAKFKPGSTVVETNNIDQLGVFDMRYGIEEEPGYVGSSCATKPKKTILVDGNLMVRVRIESISPRGDIKSDNIYTYYYCPTETKSISVNVNHEVLKTHEIEEPSILDGTYAGIVSIKSRSATIEKMNVGEILPSISLYSEDDTIREYFVQSNPDSEKKEEVLSTNTDSDLGKKAWVCLNDPSTGKAHGLIMHSNTGLTAGEEDGVQVKAYVKQNIKLPGLEADTGNLYLLRNSYEKGKEHNTVLSQGFNVNFNVEFITVETEGYEKIDSESEIFQTLIKTTPIFRGNATKEEEEVEKFTLKAYVHLAPSAPLGSLLSAALGKNIPYIYAELYKDNSLKSSGSVGRLSLATMDINLEGKKLLQMIKTAIELFDWRNASFFKKIIFPGLESGIYIVKIFKENPLFTKERQYIGFAIVEIKEEDTFTHIYCRSEGTIELSIFDQDKKGVENVQFLLLKDSVIIANMVSDKNGSIILKAPCFPTKPYTLKVIYHGFLVAEKKVTIGLKNRFKALKESFSIEHYSLNLKILDKWGFTPAVEVNPRLTSNEMIEPVYISAEKTGDGEYLFDSLYPSQYLLSMSYKSFDLEESVSIDKDISLNLMFPAEYNIDFNIMNSYGDYLSDGEIAISRNGETKTKEIDQNGKTVFTVPPGEYEIVVFSDDEEIAKQKVIVRGDKKIDIVTSQGSLFHTIIIYLGIILAIFSFIILFWKRKIYTGMKLLSIAFIIIALVSSWWVVNGDDGITSTTTNTFLIPSNIVTFTSSSNILGGDVSQVPEEVTMVLGLLSILLSVTGLLVFISIFTKKRLRKTTIILSILSIVLVIASVSIFFYAMSQLTEASVGSFIGSGDLEITIPGIAESKIIACSWAPGIGFYMGIIAVFCLIITLFDKKLEKCFIKKSK